MIPTIKYRADKKNAFWLSSNTEEEQNLALVALLKKAFKQGYSPSDVAILVRSARRSAPPIIRALKENGVPVFCPQISFIENSVMNGMFIPLFRLFSLREAKTAEDEAQQDRLYDEFEQTFRTSKKTVWKVKKAISNS